MYKPMIWIIDEEWPNYEIENEELKNAFPGCEIRYSKYNYHPDLEEFGKDADAILSQIYTVLGEKEMAKLKKCQVISVFGGGYDKIDVASAKKHNIKVTFVPGYCVEDVSDHAIAAIFHCNKKITSYAGAITNGLWGSPALPNPPKRLKGSNLLVVGLGRIGSATAIKAHALGMNVFAYDPYVEKETMASLRVVKTELFSGLENADYVSIHAKRTHETEGMIGMNELSRMKPSAYVINTARGQIIDEQSLIKAVKEKTIAGAVLDVVHTEPPTYREEVFNTPGILITPHISYLSIQAFEELKRRASQNVIKILKGEPVTDLAL